MKELLLKLTVTLYKEKSKQKLEYKNLRRFHVHILHHYAWREHNLVAA